MLVKRLVVDEYGKEKNIEDIKLTRYGGYLLALNADPQKEEVAFVQAYFVTQTRKIEVLQQKLAEYKRLDVREKLKVTEKDFAQLIMARGVNSKGIAIIKSEGDKALFGGRSTVDMKRKYGIPSRPPKPLADFLPSIALKAKDLAMAMTTENTKKRNLKGAMPIKNEHEDNNKGVRNALVKSGIYLENLPPESDITKIQATRNKELRKLKQPKRSVSTTNRRTVSKKKKLKKK